MSFYRAHRIPAGIVAPLNDLLLLGIVLQVGLSANFVRRNIRVMSSKLRLVNPIELHNIILYIYNYIYT